MIHARISPSGADRALVCTASTALIDSLIKRGEIKESDLEDDRIEQISEEEIFDEDLGGAYQDVVLDPTRESTSFSAEGTVLHTVRSNCLVFGDDPYDYVGRTLSADDFTFVITEDMADRLTAGIDWIRENAENPIIEERVSLDDWLPGQHGFCDSYWLVPVTVKKVEMFDLYVSDYKNGVGEPVPAVGTRQLRLYALGAWLELGRPSIRKVILNIDQPRAGGMKFWEITFDELTEFGEEVRRTYARIEAGDVEFVPNSKSCRWCPVKKTKRGCAAYNRWMLSMIGVGSLDLGQDELKFVDPAQMPRAHRYYIVRHAADIRAWLAKMHEASLAAGIEGDPDPGSKAIEGSGRRYFTNPEAAAAIVEDALGEKAYTKKLIGFTELDTTLKPGRKRAGYPDHWERLTKLVDLSEGKPKLVPADHPAPAFTRAVEDDFEDQIDDSEDDFEDQDL